ncbi:MAG: 23S rRNA (guanosine(2251)-2'-O)-methyltransferase RlmB [Lachnospiraceae bacterium]|nr:23S rRNA (guanosine(2251)-2'-O)-methyltransferase RlmB [Lachnospiraceae bacterium]
MAPEELEGRVEGRNPVIEAFRSGRTVEKLYVQEGVKDGPIETILRNAKKADTIVSFVSKERLDEMSETGRHQGVIARVSAYEYASVDDILKKAEEAGEAPFIILLDGIEDPHNLGAIIRTACLAGAHGVIIRKHRAVGLTPAAVRASAGAVHYVPVARVLNLGSEIERLKEKGVWFVSADMKGKSMYELPLTGPIGLVVGSEGEGVGRLISEKCDFHAAIPMKGAIDSLNASVAAGVLMYEIVRQRGI